MAESLKTIRELTVKYQTEGVEKFAEDFAKLLGALEQKRAALVPA